MIQPGRPYDELGRRLTSDYPVYDGRGSDAALVARMQGITVLVGNAHQLFTIVFETGRYGISCMCTSFSCSQFVGVIACTHCKS